MSSTENKQRLLVEMIMRQTNYSYEEAESNLIKHNNNYLTVIRESMGSVSNKTETPEKQVSINQGIYKEIRGMMDTAAATHRKTKEMEEKKDKILAYLEEQQQKKKDMRNMNSLLKIKEGDEDENSLPEESDAKRDKN
jgi:hypothetical protein